MIKTKTCFKCNEEKPLDEFYCHSGMTDGHLNKCKECTKRDVAENREKNHARICEYDRQRARTSKRKENNIHSQRKRRRAHPEKQRAYNAVRRAIDKGKLTRTSVCEICGASECKIEAHHSDYSRPLDVQWLCFRCHRSIGHGQTIEVGK